jgi:hypothetical protein
VLRIPAPRVSPGPDGAEPRDPEQSAGTRNTPERVPDSSGTAVPPDRSGARTKSLGRVLSFVSSLSLTNNERSY